jgi:hypothetical protein
MRLRHTPAMGIAVIAEYFWQTYSLAVAKSSAAVVLSAFAMRMRG